MVRDMRAGLPVPLDQDQLPVGIRSRFVETATGLRTHLLEAAGDKGAHAPLLLLLHGFPELAYSWRHVIVPLASAGFHVVAPDQRGYGRTTGWDGDYDGDWESFRLLTLVRDALSLVRALGYESAHAVIGHDFGSPVAALCALVRPDIFTRVAMMSAPFSGIAPLPLGESPLPAPPDVDRALAGLARPRKHYQRYFTTREADGDMRHSAQGVHDFLRAYFHVKSADWPATQPVPLAAWTADELAKMPTYYVMDRERDMAQTVAPAMPSAEHIATCRWLPDEELAVYSTEFERTGFQGALNWYRSMLAPAQRSEFLLYSGRRIEVPSCFIAGTKDWGPYQVPGALDTMRQELCTDFRGCHFVESAGHWVQQEASGNVVDLLLEHLAN